MVETIAFFGATGMTGKYLVPLALKHGYKVQALVRTPSKMQTQHENLKVIHGDFSNLNAVTRTVAGADYVICCAGGAVGKPKEYPKDLMLNFISMLLPIMEAEPSLKVFLFQAGGFCKTPDGKLPFAFKLMRPMFARVLGIVPNLLDNEAVIRFLDKNKPNSFRVIVTRPGQLLDKDNGMKLVASAAPEMKPVTFKALAALTLDAVNDESLFGKYPYCAIAKA